MVDVLGTASAVVGLVGFTESLVSNIRGFVRSVGEVPKVVSSVKIQVATWQMHLDALHGFSQRHNINQHLDSVLKESGVLRNAQECLKGLNDIITKATPPESGQTRASEIWDQVAFRWKQSEVEDLLKQLDDSTNHIQLALTTNTAETVADLRSDFNEVATAMFSAQEASALFSWLEPAFNPRCTDPEMMHFEKSDLQEPSTCTWMTESTLWREWLQGGSASIDGCRRFLWIHGLPGTGKTILASFLIDKLLDNFIFAHDGPGKAAKGVSYYYCHQAHNRDETIPFLRWVVRDLCMQLVPPMSIPEQIQGMWQCKQLSIERLMDCLQALAGRFLSQHQKRVYIVIDAIDESRAPRDKFLDVLTTIGTSTRFENVSLLITSRQYQDIKGAIEDLPLMAFHKVGLACRPPATQPSLPASTSGRRGGAYQPPKTPPPPTPLPRHPSPSKGPHAFMDGPRWGGEIDPPTTFPSQNQLSPTKRSFGNLTMDDSSDTSPTRRRLENEHMPPCTSLSMANPHVEKAITVYVDTRLARSRRFRDWTPRTFLDELRRILAAKAGGIFRTVVCHLEIIDNLGLTQESKILECINSMPDTIFETYEQMLVTIVPDGGDANKEDREFARTALALMCSDTASIPDAEVLIAASRTTLPQLEAQFYNCEKLRRLLGCLVKVTRDPRPSTRFKRKKEDGVRSAPLFSVAHYTVKEFLYSEKAAVGPASYFAVTTHTNQILELRIAFDGLRRFDPRAKGTPTRYEEYCLEMTDKALALRPVIVENDGRLQDAVFVCLTFDAPHRGWATQRSNIGLVKQHFPIWSTLSPFERDGTPSYRETGILINLLLLQWPNLARKYLTTLGVREKEMVWRDKFTLSVQHSKSLPQRTLVQMCISRRRLDFLKIFTAHGLHFEDPRDDVLFRAMSEPYDRDDADGGITLALLKKLLEHGADPNPTGFRVTPLQVATHYLERNWVHQLLSRGANVHGVGETTGVDPLPLTDEFGDREWYGLKPLKICMERVLPRDGKLTPGMQRGVTRLIRQYLKFLNGEVILLD